MSSSMNFPISENVGAFFDLFQGFAFSCNSDRKILFMNRKLRAFIGEDTTDDKFCFNVLFGFDKPCPWCPEDAALQGEHVTADIHSPKDGKWYRVVHSPIISADSSTMFVLCVDITEEKAAQADRDLFSVLLSRATDAVFLIEAETSKVIYANDAACRHLGYTAEELKNLRVTDFGLNVPDMEAWGEHQSYLVSKGSRYIETLQRRRDSSTVPVGISVNRVTYAGKDYCISVVRDISDRVLAQQALIEEKNKMEAVITGITDGVMMVDRDLRIVFQNQAHQQMQGNHEGEVCHRAFHARETPCPGCQVILGYEDGRTHRRETPAEAEGSKIFLEATATPVRDASGKIIGALEIVRDITEQKRIEEELSKAQKLESLALLAGGIAHDFNNLLAVMLGNISLAVQKTTDLEICRLLQETEKASMRCRQLTEQLLTFSKHGSLSCKSASAVDLVREASDFILHGTSIACTCVLPDDLWPIRVDEGQVSQVFTNILVNAREALSEQGKISISACNMEVETSKGLSLKPGRYVRITIHNDGEPIQEQVLPRIFDPYFTTKKTGNGLGLATSYAIIRKHGGEITVDSKPFSGTSFHIFLPASDEALSSSNEDRKVLPSPRNGRRALVMDDEPGIILMMRAMLHHIGIETVGCCNGDEAETEYVKAMAERNRFDVVVLDLTIKGGTGGEIALQKLKALDPEVVAIVSTGYTEGDFESMDGWSGKLKKPFTLRELSQVLAVALP